MLLTDELQRPVEEGYKKRQVKAISRAKTSSILGVEVKIREAPTPRTTDKRKAAIEGNQQRTRSSDKPVVAKTMAGKRRRVG
jgi:hypothetical protein